MGKLSEKDMEELREFCSLGCDYSGTEETVEEITRETFREMGICELQDACEIGLVDWDEDTVGNLDDFIKIFWEKAVERILNVVETQGR